MPYRIRGIIRAHTGAVEEEADCGLLLPLTVTESIHELFQGGRPLDLEKNFIVIVGHLDIEVLDRGGWCLLLG